MATTPVYSTLFFCLYDEPAPIGSLGRGTHYSVFRAAEWLDVIRSPLQLPEVHDFAVIWDEDHDTRVMEAVERIYMAGLLSPIQFIGERKGSLTVLVAARFWGAHPKAVYNAYCEKLGDVTSDLGHGDSWAMNYGHFDRAPSPAANPHQTETAGIIHDSEHRVVTYLRNIDSLWSLGTKPYKPTTRALGSQV
jgi:hypothetical protein